MSGRNIFWGVVLIALGSLFIFRNLDIIFFSWMDILRLWPFLLVILGVSMLPVKSSLKALFMVLTVIFAVVVLLIGPPRYFGFSWMPHDKIFQHREITEQKIFEQIDEEVQQATLIFDAAVGHFTIDEGTSNLFDFNKRGNIGKYVYSVKELGDTREIHVSLDETKIGGINIRNKAVVKLNKNLVWDLDIDVGAADIKMDLRDFKIRSVEIDGGASAIKLILGDLYEETKVNIDAGASSIKIRIPEGSACELNTDIVLATKNIKGFNKVASGMYVTPNFSESSNNIMIDVDVAVSTLKIERY